MSKLPLELKKIINQLHKENPKELRSKLCKNFWWSNFTGGTSEELLDKIQRKCWRNSGGILEVRNCWIIPENSEEILRETREKLPDELWKVSWRNPGGFPGGNLIELSE